MPGGVNEPQEHAAAGDGFLHRVPGGAGNVGDDGAVIAGQRVEQGGFSGVWATDDGGADAAFQYPAPSGGVQQGGKGAFGRVKRGFDLLWADILDVLVR